MDVLYRTEEGSLCICFEDYEASDLAVTMQLVFEDEKKRGKRVPPFGRDFFKEISNTKGKVAINFDVEYFECAFVFLEAVREKMIDNNSDTAGLGVFLEQVWPYYADPFVLH